MLLAVISRRGRALLTIVLTLGGAALLAQQVARVGLAPLRGLIVQVGWGFALVLALSLGRLLMRGLAWRALLRPQPSAATALSSVIAGDAIGNLTPLNLLAGEPAKVLYLGRGTAPPQAFAALAAENFFYSVSVAVYVVAGTAAMLVAFEHELPAPVVQAGVAVLLLMAALLAGAGWLAWQRPSVLSGALRALRIPRLARMVDRVRQFEVDAYGSAGGHGARVLTVIACDTGFHALSFLEAWLTLTLLTGSSDPLAAFVFDTANRVVNVVFRFVPMRAGVDQVAASSVSTAIGLPADIGIAMSLVRFARVAAWAATGVALIAARRR